MYCLAIYQNFLGARRLKVLGLSCNIMYVFPLACEWIPDSSAHDFGHLCGADGSNLVVDQPALVNYRFACIRLNLVLLQPEVAPNT